MYKRYELVIFDWDGTLMDSTARIVSCLQQSALLAGLTMPSVDDARHIIGLGLHEGFRVLFPDADDKHEKEMLRYYKEEFVHRNNTKHELFSGVLDWLGDSGRDAVLIAVATGKSRVGLDRELTAHGMHEYFVCTRCADECFSKPNPQMVLEILSETGMAPEQAIMVGDTTFDLDMAQAAGIDALGLTQGAHNKEQLLNSTPTHVVASFAEAANWLNERIS